MIFENDLLCSPCKGRGTGGFIRYFNESFGFDDLMEMSNPDVFELIVGDEKAMLKRIWDDRV